jgi:hypothetical protein
MLAMLARFATLGTYHLRGAPPAALVALFVTGCANDGPMQSALEQGAGFLPLEACGAPRAAPKGLVSLTMPRRALNPCS